MLCWCSGVPFNVTVELLFAIIDMNSVFAMLSTHYVTAVMKNKSSDLYDKVLC